MTEIDRDFYCVADFYKNGMCNYDATLELPCFGEVGCKYHRRKWPTPEQYTEEYGELMLDDSPVWLIIPEGDDFPDWTLMPYAEALQYEHEEKERAYSQPIIHIVCACTPWYKPSKDWRPELV